MLSNKSWLQVGRQLKFWTAEATVHVSTQFVDQKGTQPKQCESPKPKGIQHIWEDMLYSFFFPSLQENYAWAKMIHIFVLIKPTMIKMNIHCLNILRRARSQIPLLSVVSCSMQNFRKESWVWRKFNFTYQKG